jgi:hypothetical protein
LAIGSDFRNRDPVDPAELTHAYHWNATNGMYER